MKWYVLWCKLGQGDRAYAFTKLAYICADIVIKKSVLMDHCLTKKTEVF